MSTSHHCRITPVCVSDSDDCVLTLSAPGQVLLSLDYMKNRIRRDVARIMHTPAFAILGTHGGALVAADMLGMGRVTFNTSTTVRLRTYPLIAQGGSVAYDTGTFTPIVAADPGEILSGVDPANKDIWYGHAGQKQFALYFGERKTFKSWRIDIAHTPGTYDDDWIDISRLFLGDETMQLTYNIPYPLESGWNESSKLWETDGGSIQGDAAEPYRQQNFDVDHVPEADRERWNRIFRYCGIGRKDFWWTTYPEGTSRQIRDFSLNAIFTQIPRPKTVRYGAESFTVNMREV